MRVGAPLHPDFGVEIEGVDLRVATHGFPEIRAAFEAHSLLLFRGQDLDDETHRAFAALFGPIEDRGAMQLMGAPTGTSRMDNVTNRLDDGTIAAADSLHTLDLTGNQRWHTDSTFLPVPALVNVLAARVLPSYGGETEFVSTRAAWDQMPETLRARIRGRTIRHRLAQSREGISEELVRRHRERWPDQLRPATWTNPINGREAIYLASHACGIHGLDDQAARQLLGELMSFCTTPDRVYRHVWQPGDVLVWDERATMHRGRAWPYHEERTLASVCVSATVADGLR